MGVITSPPIRADFPANAFTPLWKASVPAGTELTVELAVSADGVHFGAWTPMAADEDAAEDISATLPDGSANPSHGFIPGGVLAFGLDMWTWFRYRITLYSETEASPRVEAFRVYYQDTTLGKGRLAVLDP